MRVRARQSYPPIAPLRTKGDGWSGGGRLQKPGFLCSIGVSAGYVYNRHHDEVRSSGSWESLSATIIVPRAVRRVGKSPRRMTRQGLTRPKPYLALAARVTPTPFCCFLTNHCYRVILTRGQKHSHSSPSIRYEDNNQGLGALFPVWILVACLGCLPSYE